MEITLHIGWPRHAQAYGLILFLLLAQFSFFAPSFFGEAISAPSIGATVEPGSLVRDCTYTFYVDGLSYLATKGNGAGNRYSGISITTVVQNAINDGGAGKYCFTKGTYDFLGGQDEPAGYNINFAGVGPILPSNIIVQGEGRGTILTTTTAVPGSPTANDYFTMFVNANPTTENGFITIRDLAVVLPAPSETGVGLQAWDNCALFNGVHDSIITNTYCKNGGWQFYPDSVNLNTVNALTSGDNYNNEISHNLIEQGTGSSTFFQGTNSRFLANTILKCWDDCFLVGSAGRNHRFIGNYIDNSFIVAGKGASDGAIRFQNDEVVSSAEGMTDHIVADNVIVQNNLAGGGATNGIYGIRAKNILIAYNRLSNNTGAGASFELSQKLTFTGNIVFGNVAGGIRILQTAAGTIYNFTLVQNTIYDNTSNGIEFAPNAVGRNIENVIIQSNIVFDPAGGLAQTNAIRFGLDGNMADVIVSDNNLGGTTAIAIQGGGTITGDIQHNIGYVTENNGAATIAASTTVTVNHGLASTPTIVVITSQSTGYGTFAVTSRNTTQFVITVTVSGTYTFDWYAEYEPI